MTDYQLNVNNSSPFECKEGELYNLTFPQGKGFTDSYRYFSQDIGSQTEESDVIQILELTNALSKLTIDNAQLHRDLNLVRSTLQSEFHRRLTNASDQLYSRMNQRLYDVERSQRDRVEVVRRAFRTQLSDALSHMASLYNQKLNNKLIKDRTSLESEESVKLNKKINDLLFKLKKSEGKIKELTKQIQEYQEFESQPTMILDSESEGSDKVEIIMEEETKFEDLDENEKSKEKDLINDLNQKIENLEKENDSYVKTIEDSHKRIKNLNYELISLNEIMESLKSEKQTMQMKIENLQDQCTKKEIQIQELHVINLSKPQTPKPEPVKEKSTMVKFDVQKNYKEFPDMSKEVLNLKDLIKELKNKEHEGTKEITKFKDNLILENKSYSQEIKILKAINSKLKEEMFSRMELQNNFKTLHSASVAYAKNKQPIGILPNQYTELQETKSRNTNIVNISAFKDKSYELEKDNELLNNFVELTI